MPTVDERLKHVTLKVKRAKEHVADLERQLRSFLDSGPYKVGVKHDSQTRKLIYFVMSAEPTPDCLPLVAGDAIQNLMSALDHLAYQIVGCDTGDNLPNPNRIYFPVADDTAKYEAKKRGTMEGRAKRHSMRSTRSNHTKEGMTSSGLSTDSITSKSTACCSLLVRKPRAYISVS